MRRFPRPAFDAIIAASRMPALARQILMSGSVTEFGAPWSRAVRWVTSLTCAAMGIVALSGLAGWSSSTLTWKVLMVALPLLLPLLALLFMVRGYRLTPSALDVRRLGWRTRLPLTGLRSVAGDAEAFQGAWRLFGNGGLFAITGLYWSRRLRRFRAWATDPARAVVLRFADRTVVITPDDPVRFIVRLRTLLATSGFPD